MNSGAKIGIIGVIIAAIVGIGAATLLMPSDSPVQPAEVAPEKLTVLASFYPILEFTNEVGGDRVDATLLVPQGIEPHDWDPTIRDIERMNAADLVVLNGVGFESWRDDVHDVNEDIVIIDTSVGIDLIEYGEDEGDAHDDAHDEDRHEDEHEGEMHEGDAHDEDRHEDEHEGEMHEGDAHGDEHGHNHTTDPHIWLDPILVKTQVQNIADGLASVDPENAEYYMDNAASFQAELDALDEEISTELESCKKDFIAYHEAFAYFAQRYGLEQHTVISSLGPHATPTASHFEDVIILAEELDITVVFGQQGVDPRIAEVLAQEFGGQVLVLSPLEIITDDSGYIENMQKNLKNLKVALCN